MLRNKIKRFLRKKKCYPIQSYANFMLARWIRYRITSQCQMLIRIKIDGLGLRGLYDITYNNNNINRKQLPCRQQLNQQYYIIVGRCTYLQGKYTDFEFLCKFLGSFFIYNKQSTQSLVTGDKVYVNGWLSLYTSIILESSFIKDNIILIMSLVVIKFYRVRLRILQILFHDPLRQVYQRFINPVGVCQIPIESYKAWYLYDQLF
eukprot:TRINITY_DN38346_c0_g1_i3.p1 TRINITY_DN38346_c0_g1~~TRINITY_DN38346_c0_g1_i3.p1  ORF type:complete len:205 (+),score=-13.49 TRINITY_DN38346_c0_g1_i3:187-801(+)